MHTLNILCRQVRHLLYILCLKDSWGGVKHSNITLVKGSYIRFVPPPPHIFDCGYPFYFFFVRDTNYVHYSILGVG